MRYQWMGDSYVLRLETGLDIVESLVEFAADRRIDAGAVLGLGAAFDVVLGYFSRATREYVRHTVQGDHEILALVGNLALKDGRPYAHLHVTLSGPDFRTLGGHLFAARVGGTCELVIRPLAGYLQRTRDETTGLFVLDL